MFYCSDEKKKIENGRGYMDKNIKITITFLFVLFYKMSSNLINHFTFYNKGIFLKRYCRELLSLHKMHVHVSVTIATLRTT